MRGLFFSGVHFVLAVAFLLFSAFFLQVAFHPGLKGSVLSFLEKPDVFLYFGIVGGFLSLLFFISLYFLHSRSFYRMEMDKGSLQVGEAIITEFIKEFFQEKVPFLSASTEVGFSGKKKMEITLYSKKQESEKLYVSLRSLEKELKAELLQKMGYKGRCFITVALLS